MRRLWLIFAQATTVALAVLFVLTTLKPEWLRPAVPVERSARILPALLPAETASLGNTPRLGYSAAARRAAPAVVSITARKKAAATDDLRERWFRFHFGPRGRDGEPRGPMGLGSGVIVSPDGYLLTNNHVVAGASEIDIALSDGREARARLVGTDPETDLALLKVDLERLPAIRLGDADSLQVGDVVLAIGNPFNVGQTVTSGIVSALGRTSLGINTFENFIQTDAAINPGNSGGALVDADGNLVGINTAIYSRSGGSLGIGFAIPVSSARQVMEALLRDGQVERGWIGVEPRELTQEIVEAFKLPTVVSGVLIRSVRSGAPAEKAGIKPGDVLMRVAGKPVQTPAQLLAIVSALKPQSAATVAVQRGERELEFKLVVAQRPRPPVQEVERD